MTYQSFEPCTLVSINTFLEKGLGKGGAKRHKKILRKKHLGYYQAGQERWCEAHSGLTYEETRGVLKISS